MLSKEDYLKNPCAAASIPYWKQKNLVLPPNMKIVHDADYRKEDYEEYTDEQYFRLYHNLKNVSPTASEEVEIVKCEPWQVDGFVNLINHSYTDLSVTAEQMQSYRKTPVYCPDLWIFLKDKLTGDIVGGGIGDFDAELGEMILEWIQVLPAYRRRGYGQIIVNHMLSTVQSKARFATVSGKINNITSPESLYRKCGFTGNDIWHILRKK